MYKPNDTILESSRRDGGANAGIVGTATPSAMESSSFENRARGCRILCHLRYILGLARLAGLALGLQQGLMLEARETLFRTITVFKGEMTRQATPPAG